MRSIIRVIDLETGPEPIDGEPGIIEYGHIDVVTEQHDMLGQPYDWRVGDIPFDARQTLVKPYTSIPPETSAIHNLVDEDVENAPVWSGVAPHVTLATDPNAKIVALAAHNIECEKTLIGDAAGGLPWIDTYKIGLRLWPESMSHSNNALRYFIRPEGLDRRLAVPTHRALPDAYVTAFTLREALNAGHSVETLIKWTIDPAILPRCKIGKFRNDGKGTPWEDVDSGFLEWILPRDFDENTKHTARYHLEQREIDQRNEYERLELNRQFRQNGMPETERFGIHEDGKPANDFQQTRSDAREHQTAPRDANTMELPL